MKNIKDITLSIFAIIGFISIITAFNTQPQQQTHGTPESHAWDMIVAPDANPVVYSYNKITGEVRKYNTNGLYVKKDGTLTEGTDANKYAVMVEAK